MKIIRALKSGALRALKVWKGVLIVWFCYLLLVSLVAIPMKGALKAGFGQSMITEMLRDGINVEVFSDLGAILTNLIAYFSSGLFLLLLFGILMNAFLTGGLFDSLKGISVKFSSAEFFRASARNFWSFLVITLLINIIILFLTVFIIGITAAITMQSYNDSGTTSFLAVIVAAIILLSVIIILILVADYARAWQVAKEKPACFKALGFGSNRTFRTFLSSFPMMLMLISVQVLFAWLVLKILGSWKPLTTGGVFLLFLMSQFLFFIRILLKTWRYGSVTSLKEKNDLLTDAQGSSNI
ncbi:MAG: hypothetical protein MUO72_14350 [Bacteroidales bacterium]|nr:hypothetical protein [Bacteroidales bacterium]